MCCRGSHHIIPGTHTQLLSIWNMETSLIAARHARRPMVMVLYKKKNPKKKKSKKKKIVIASSASERGLTEL